MKIIEVLKKISKKMFFAFEFSNWNLALSVHSMIVNLLLLLIIDNVTEYSLPTWFWVLAIFIVPLVVWVANLITGNKDQE
jgi:uncharacterized membrane protein